MKKNSKKLMSLLLTLVMLLSISPAVFAVDADTVPQGSDTPESPMLVSEALVLIPDSFTEAIDQLGQADNGSYSYHVTTYDGENALPAGTQLEPGKAYELRATIRAAEGYIFPEFLACVFADSQSTYDKGNVASTDSGREVVCYMTITADEAEAPALQSIAQVEAAVPAAPEAVPAITGAAADGAYTYTAAILDGETVLPEGQALEPGHTYSLRCTFLASAGYRFAESVQVKLNLDDGEALTLTAAPTEEGAKLEALHEFTLPAPQPASVARIVRDGANVDYTTLDEALDDAKDGETVIILQNCATSWTQGYYLGKSLTLDLQGHTVSLPQGFCVSGGKTLRVVGGTVQMQGVQYGCNDVGSYKFGACIVLNGGAKLQLEGAAMNLNCVTGDGIYGHPGCTVNLIGSTMNITGCKGNGMTKDDGVAYINLTNSTLNTSNNRSGINNYWVIDAKDSTLTASGNRAHGTNGSDLMVSNSQVNFSNNGTHGLSLSKFLISNGSRITTADNGYYGVYLSNDFSMDGTSAMTITGNATSGSGAGFCLSSNGTGEVASGAVVTITGNHRNGLENYRSLHFAEGAQLTVTGNYETNQGGGIYNMGALVLPTGAVIVNNHAANGGDDVMNDGNGTITLPAVAPGQHLDGTEGTSDCLNAIDGWYLDNGETRWNAHSLEGLYVEAAAPGAITGVVGLKAAHGVQEKNVHNPAVLQFCKTDAATGKPVAGAEFTLYADELCTRAVQQYVSDAQGLFSVSQPAGTYYLKETKAPAGYRLNSDVMTITVRESEVRFERLLDETTSPAEVLDVSTVDDLAEVKGLNAGETGVYLLENEAYHQITVKKVWEDSSNTSLRAKSVEVSVLANGKEIERFTLNADNQWQESMDVPTYDENGKLITYSVKELTQLKDYTTSYRDGGLTVVNTLKTADPAEPKTGDDSHIGLYLSLCGLSVLAMGAVLTLAKKKHEN